MAGTLRDSATEPSETGVDARLCGHFPTQGERPPGELEALKKVWETPTGWRAFSAVNNNFIGFLFIVTAFGFFVAAGILSLLMRVQLAAPMAGIVPQETYNQLLTMHGSVMMILFAVPAVEAIAVLLLPQMIGARDLPFAAAIELIVGVLRTLVPGMTLAKVPVYAWAVLIFGVMIILAFPAMIMVTFLLELERAFNWPFFDATRGGDPLLYQHLFWFFAHPDVYIIFIPTSAMVSTMIVTLAQKPLVGHEIVVLAIIATGIISFGVLAHHMFTVAVGSTPYSLGAFVGPAPLGLPVIAGNPRDLNNDGKTDMLFQNSSTGKLYVWYMNGAGVISSGGYYAGGQALGNWRAFGR